MTRRKLFLGKCADLKRDSTAKYVADQFSDHIKNYPHSAGSTGFFYFHKELKAWTVTSKTKNTSVLPIGNSNAYTATEDCVVCFSISWDCSGSDSFKVVMTNGVYSFDPFGMGARETNETALDQFYGTFNLPKGWRFYFTTYGASVKTVMYSTCRVYSIA